MRRLLAVAAAGLALAGAACDGGAATPAPSAAGGAAEPGPGDHRLSLPHGGRERTYLLHAPPTYDRTTPTALVIALHPYPGSGAAIREMAGLDAVADREDVLVAYPDGTGGGFNALICCGDADDVGFLTALTEHLVRTWGADPDRVYLTGISNGGDMSFRAAVEASGVFAAIGAVSGGYGGPRTEADDYVPTRPVSVITFIGGQDRYADAFRVGMRTWQRRLGCRPAPAAPGGAPGVTRTDARCADGSDVTVYTLPEMGHAWPGAATGQLADPDAGVSATDLIWEFFAAHPRRP
ncbi:alpha/beta hydrolase family esterase [Micromonospora globbae]|uniref:Polyhydroxybutyrate depolymerase n=1 Tax=Micromonospora globbae TaxID=1894969 RepID=A0A420F5I5_9ACTN|nr:PHB depolymerase family esterase [Micromonospora globbae]RKF28181.1 polyhydroxybutyrate depolymerase [Micromonospora globbae]